MDLLLNIPVATLSFMVCPGMVAGAIVVMQLLPFTIVPYMVIFLAPVLAMITLWPMLSLFGHGFGNHQMLYGSLIYVGYGLITSYAAFVALHSLEALKMARVSKTKDGEMKGPHPQAYDNQDPHAAVGAYDPQTIPPAHTDMEKIHVSMEMSDEVVQGTLLSYLHSTMLPQMATMFQIGKLLYIKKCNISDKS